MQGYWRRDSLLGEMRIFITAFQQCRWDGVLILFNNKLRKSTNQIAQTINQSHHKFNHIAQTVNQSQCTNISTNQKTQTLIQSQHFQSINHIQKNPNVKITDQFIHTNNKTIKKALEEVAITILLDKYLSWMFHQTSPLCPGDLWTWRSRTPS